MKILNIRSCNECPYCSVSAARHVLVLVCCNDEWPDSKGPIYKGQPDYIAPIPDWCPLPDQDTTEQDQRDRLYKHTDSLLETLADWVVGRFGCPYGKCKLTDVVELRDCAECLLLTNDAADLGRVLALYRAGESPSGAIEAEKGPGLPYPSGEKK